jgi:hypothetical protein
LTRRSPDRSLPLAVAIVGTFLGADKPRKKFRSDAIDRSLGKFRWPDASIRKYTLDHEVTVLAGREPGPRLDRDEV